MTSSGTTVDVGNSSIGVGRWLDGRVTVERFANPREAAARLAGRVAVALENGRLLGEALEAIEARDTFLSVAAHELRTPLTSLLLQIEMSRRAVNRDRFDGPAALRAINSTAIQAGKLSALIDSLLDVGRLRTGRFTMEPEEMDLGQVVLDTVAMMTPDAANPPLPDVPKIWPTLL